MALSGAECSGERNLRHVERKETRDVVLVGGDLSFLCLEHLEVIRYATLVPVLGLFKGFLGELLIGLGNLDRGFRGLNVQAGNANVILHSAFEVAVLGATLDQYGLGSMNVRTYPPASEDGNIYRALDRI